MFDAVVLGLGAMIGAGVFAAVGPAADAAGSALLIGLVIAGLVAFCNATSAAQLAALYPESGGTYVYGRQRLGAFWGYLAGWGFVASKIAGCAAIALTFGAYLAPEHRRWLAAAVVLAATGVNYAGIRKTAWVTRLLVTVVLACLAVVVFALLAGGTASPDRLDWPGTASVMDVLRAAGLLFFAFAGYARIATLGEEVTDPSRIIPRAIPIALGITLAVYLAVAGSALLAAGPQVLAGASAPLDAAVRSGSFASLSFAARAGGIIAALGVLLSLLAGVSRTTFAMASDGNLPRWLDAVHPIRRVPHHAELAVGGIVAGVTVLVDLRQALGFSAFVLLVYYAIANVSAWTLSASQRRWPRWVAVAGLLGCVVLALALPLKVIAAGAAILVLGALWWPARVWLGTD